ncbi:MAG: FtsX-like permease family protein [Nocardioides sp.]
MWRVSLRNLLARKLRLALSAFAIVLGVAFVAGSFVFTDSLSGAFNGIVKGTTADVEVAPHRVIDVESIGTDSRTLPASLMRRIRAIPDAAQVSGTAEVQGVFVIGADGKLVGGNGPPGLAFNYTDMTAIAGDRILTLTQGRLPVGVDQIALDEDAARKAGYRIGDEVTLATPGDPPVRHATLTGLVRFGSSGGLVGATLTIFDLRAIRDLFFDGRPVYSGISVRAAPGVSQARLRDEVQQVLPKGVEARTGDDVAQETERSIATVLGFINTFLLVFAGIAMVVGAFLIVNTFSILVAQRGRELALLRAMGASKRQVNVSVLAEACVVGVFGSTVGIGLGYLLAHGLKALFGAIGLDLGKAGMPLEPRTVLVSYAVGVTVTALAAFLPAYRAGRVSPVEAMRDDVSVPESSLRRRMWTGASLLGGGIGLMVAGRTGVVGHGLALTGLGMLVVLIGVSLTSSVIGQPVLRGLGTVYHRAFGIVGDLATENSLRNPRRTAATSSALMIGLALVALMSILGQSAKVSTAKAIDGSLTAGLVVSNVTQQPFSPVYAREIRKLDGVRTAAVARAATGRSDGHQVSVTAVGPGFLDGALRLPMSAGVPDGLGVHRVLVASRWAAGRDLGIGDRFEVSFPSGTHTYVVGGIYASGGPIGSDLVLTTAQLKAGGFTPEDAVVLVTATPGASESRVRAEIDEVLKGNPTVTLKNQQEFLDEQKAQINTLLSIVYALLGLAIVIAVLGITNTLALSVIERTREVGLLRAIGLGRRQLRRMVRLESIAISALGAVLGVAMGIAFGVVLQRSVADRGVGTLSIPWLQLAIFVALSVLVGSIAAVFPARRAARFRILDAITTE